jgi:hypothetical protein
MVPFLMASAMSTKGIEFSAVKNMVIEPLKNKQKLEKLLDLKHIFDIVIDYRERH